VREGARASTLALDYGAALAKLATLRPAVDRLFTELMVMADDPGVRANRLGLLRSIADEFALIADFTRLSSEG
jgi:glycyl-tRNA synthetase beta chain